MFLPEEKNNIIFDVPYSDSVIVHNELLKNMTNLSSMFRSHLRIRKIIKIFNLEIDEKNFW